MAHQLRHGHIHSALVGTDARPPTGFPASAFKHYTCSDPTLHVTAWRDLYILLKLIYSIIVIEYFFVSIFLLNAKL
jgi:hypothetical protein